MRALVDTSVMIDVLRGDDAAVEFLTTCDEVHASEVSRAEVLTGMRAPEKVATHRLLSVFTWHPLDAKIAEVAGRLGRTYRRSHQLDVADLVIAATALHLDAELATRNVKHFPMWPDLAAPY
ncbi:MAG: type II toxin-antitoxin system VapC family toxin [Micrococcales bacterium]|nr:type II toxin-antitoxin system VapC family toxin [Micrococcales bacterium]